MNKWKSPCFQFPSHGTAHALLCKGLHPREPLDSLHSKFDLHPSDLQGIAPSWAGSSLGRWIYLDISGQRWSWEKLRRNESKERQKHARTPGQLVTPALLRASPWLVGKLVRSWAFHVLFTFSSQFCLGGSDHQHGQALPSQPSQKFGQVKQGRGVFPF